MFLIPHLKTINLNHVLEWVISSCSFATMLLYVDDSQQEEARIKERALQMINMFSSFNTFLSDHHLLHKKKRERSGGNRIYMMMTIPRPIFLLRWMFSCSPTHTTTIRPNPNLNIILGLSNYSWEHSTHFCLVLCWHLISRRGFWRSTKRSFSVTKRTFWLSSKRD